MSETLQYIRTENGHFQCPHCDKVCEKQNTMYYHVKTKHLAEFKYSCSVCAEAGKTMQFVQKCTYLKHMAAKHPESEKEKEGEKNPYVGVSNKCPACDHTNTTKANLLVHFARHHCKDWIPGYTKNMTCKGCERVFPSSTAYLYHALACIKPIPEDYANMLSLIK